MLLFSVLANGQIHLSQRYRIAPVDKLDAVLLASKVVSRTSTAASVVAGLACLELYKHLAGTYKALFSTPCYYVICYSPNRCTVTRVAPKLIPESRTTSAHTECT